MKKILVIESDDAVNQLFEAKMRELDLEFISSTRLIPLHEILAIKPDVIVIDYRPPFGFGGDLCKELKTDPRTAAIKVILTSTDRHIPKIACENFADACLHKPFDIDLLTSTLTRLSADSRPAATVLPKKSFWAVLGV